MQEQKYGLLLTKKTKSDGKTIGSNIFGDDDDDSNAVVVTPRPLITLDKSSSIDPSVDYSYDEHFEREKQERKMGLQMTGSGSLDRKPRYMNALLAKAKERQVHAALVEQRQLLKEREKEGDTFRDKEVFVTDAYKEHLAQLKEQEKLLEKEQDEKRNQGQFLRDLLDARTRRSNPVEDEQNQVPSDTSKSTISQQPKSSATIRLSTSQQEFIQQQWLTKQQQEAQQKVIDPKLYSRRNTPEMIEQAKLRYLERKKQRQLLKKD